MASKKDLMKTDRNLPVPNAPRANGVAAMAIVLPVALGAFVSWLTLNPAGVIVGALVGALLSQSPKIAKQWEKAVVLRLGRYVGLRGPGLFFILPLLDSVSAWVDQRIITT